MKKNILLFVFVFTLIVSVAANAQSNRFGLMGGLNLANLSNPDLEFDNLTAFGFGGVFELALGNNFALCLEPMYLQKGASLDFMGISEIDFKLAYLEMPLLFKVPFSTSPTKPYVIGGPTIGYLLSSNLEVTVLGVKVIDEDVKEETKNLDYGVIIGAGVSFQMGNTSVFVEARYALGLVDVSDLEEEDIEEDVPNLEELKTKGIHIMAGVTFPLGGQ